MKKSTCSVDITLCSSLVFPKIGKFKKQLHERVIGLSKLTLFTNFVTQLVKQAYFDLQLK